MARGRRENWIVFAVSAVAAILSYLATSIWPETPDGFIHLVRVQALTEALRAGVLYPRWFPDFAYGYGYPTLHYYAPGFYYPAALLHWFGADAIVATRLVLALLTGLSLWAMVRLTRHWVTLPAALASGILYIAFTYRMYDLFVRGALPEYAAFLWLPLVAASTVSLAESARMRPLASALSGPFVATALCWAGLLLTHNLTALMAGFMAAICALVWLIHGLIRKDARPVMRALVTCAAAWAVGTLVAAWYVAPALLDADMVGIGSEDPTGYANHFATWATLFSWRIPFAYPSAADATVALPGVVLIVGLCALVLLVARRSRGQRMVIGVTLIVLCVSIWLTTASSAPVWQLLQPVLGRLQFPWRWQSLAAGAFALLVAFLIDAPRTRSPEIDEPGINWPKANWRSVHARPMLSWTLAAAISALLLVISLGGLHWQPATLAGEDVTTAGGWAWDDHFGQTGVTWAGEFLPRWVTEQRWAIGRAPETPASEGMPAATGSLHLVEAGYQRARFDTTGLTAPVTFHRFYFPGWQVSSSGQALETQPVTPLGLLQAALPPAQGTMTISPQATISTWVGRLLTLVGWLVIGWLLWRGRRRAVTLTLWFAAGVIALFAATGWSEATLASQPVQADYGDVQLTGLVVTPVRAGETATIRPFWFVRDPAAEWVVFVHVIDASGAVVAQRDEPLGTAYTPSGRLVPGEVVDTPIFTALPNDLEPGEYALRIGVYPAGQPTAPLLPEGSDAPFVMGTLEVSR